MCVSNPKVELNFVPTSIKSAQASKKPHPISFFFLMTLRPNADLGILSHEVYRSHTQTHHSRQDSSGRVIISSQRPLPDNTQRSQETDIHAPGGIRTHKTSLRPRGHWDHSLFRASFSFKISQDGDYWRSKDALTGISLEANITANSADLPAILRASPKSSSPFLDEC